MPWLWKGTGSTSELSGIFYFGSNHSRSESTQWDSQLPAIELRQRSERNGRRALEQGIRLPGGWLCHASGLAGLEEGLQHHPALPPTLWRAVPQGQRGPQPAGKVRSAWKGLGRQRKQDPNSYHPGVLASHQCLAIVLMLLWSSVGKSFTEVSYAIEHHSCKHLMALLVQIKAWVTIEREFGRERWRHSQPDACFVLHSEEWAVYFPFCHSTSA